MHSCCNVIFVLLHHLLLLFELCLLQREHATIICDSVCISRPCYPAGLRLTCSMLYVAYRLVTEVDVVPDFFDDCRMLRDLHYSPCTMHRTPCTIQRGACNTQHMARHVATRNVQHALPPEPFASQAPCSGPQNTSSFLGLRGTCTPRGCWGGCRGGREGWRCETFAS